MNVHNDVLVSCSRRMEFTIRENVDEFGEDVTGKCCSFSVVCESELLLSQKQRKGLALPEMRRVSGGGGVESRLTVWRAGTGLEKEPPGF